MKRNRKGQFRAKTLLAKVIDRIRPARWDSDLQCLVLCIGGIAWLFVYGQVVGLLNSNVVYYTASVVEAHEITELQPEPLTVEEKIRLAFPERPETMLAIAKCENGWTENRGFVPDQQSLGIISYGRELSFGVFQIHQPDWHDTAMKLELYDYRTHVDDNIAMARYIYDVQGITAWTCFNNGGYIKFL